MNLNNELNQFLKSGKNYSIASLLVFLFPNYKKVIEDYSGDYNKILNKLNVLIVKEKDIFKNVIHQYNQQIYRGDASDEEYKVLNLINNAFNIVINETLPKLEFEKQLKNQNPQMQMGFLSNNLEYTFPTLLRAIYVSKDSNKYLGEIVAIFIKHGFDFDQLIKDDESGNVGKNVIDELCENLNDKAKKGKIFPVIGRDNEIDRMINILKKIRKNNPILVGHAGVGKTAIVEGLALKITQGDVPDFLKNAVIYNLQTMNLVKGTEYRGKMEQKISDLLEAFQRMEKSKKVFPILFIDELHSIMGAGGSQNLDFSNMIKPALSRGELRTIGATTVDEYHQFIKKNEALDRRFNKVTVDEPSKEDTFKMLLGNIDIYEKRHKTSYDQNALLKAINLSCDWIPDNKLPDKAFDLIDEAGVIAYREKRGKVDEELIARALAKSKNIPLDSILQSEKDKIESVLPYLKQRIIGQDHVLEPLARAVNKHKVGLSLAEKPIGSFLFTGMTGTGKTETAKALADLTKSYLFRIDCSEYMEEHAVSKLIGSPPGYVGHDQGALITKIFSQHPRVVWLIDEIEKAHPKFKNILLQAMDYGKITDSNGKSVYLNNSIIIMTSNAGAEQMSKKSLGFHEGKNSKVDDVVNSYFPQEFRGRLTGNGPLYFNPMTKELMTTIAKKEIENLNKDRFGNINLKINFTDKAIDHFVDEALARRLGARPLKDLLEQEVVEKVADNLMNGLKLSKVKVDIKAGKIVFL